MGGVLFTGSERSVQLELVTDLQGAGRGVGERWGDAGGRGPGTSSECKPEGRGACGSRSGRTSA